MLINTTNNPFKSRQWYKKDNLERDSLKKDTLIVGLLGGATGAFVMELSNFLSSKKLYFGRAAASMLVNPARSIRSKNIPLGEIIHLITGAGIGAAFVALLKKTGKDFIYIKGLFAGLTVWVGLHNLGRRMDFITISPHTTTSHYRVMLQHLLFGATMAGVIKHVADPSIFEQPSRSRNNVQSINSRSASQRIRPDSIN